MGKKVELMVLSLKKPNISVMFGFRRMDIGRMSEPLVLYILSMYSLLVLTFELSSFDWTLSYV